MNFVQKKRVNIIHVESFEASVKVFGTPSMLKRFDITKKHFP